MCQAKGIDAVQVTKVKGHATEEMVTEGRVERKDKCGNDGADKAADKGSGEAQKTVMELAGLLSFRNEKYRQIMERIQKIIIGMKKAEKELRQSISTQKDPTQHLQQDETKTKKSQKKLVGTSLDYFVDDGGNARNMQIQNIKRQVVDDDFDFKYMVQLIFL